MSKTNYLEDAVLNHFLRGVSAGGPYNPYVALFTSAPGEAAGGTEVSGGSYARRACGFSAPVSGAVTNAADITYPQATASWGTITHFAIFDALSGGNMLYYGTLPVSKTVGTDDIFEFLAGTLSVTEL